MAHLAFPTPTTVDPDQPPAEPAAGGDEVRYTSITVKLGDTDCAVIGIDDDGYVRIAELGRDRLCSREALTLAWALSVLAANDEVRW